MSTLLRVILCGLALVVVLWGSCVIALASLDDGPILLFVAVVVLVAGLWGVGRLWRRTRVAGDR